MANNFLATQIAALETLIAAYNAAELALITNGMQTYTLDTGQDRQTVTKLDIKWIGERKEAALNQWAVLNARCGGTGVTTGVPIW